MSCVGRRDDPIRLVLMPSIHAGRQLLVASLDSYGEDERLLT
jgi:hypothetical protein